MARILVVEDSPTDQHQLVSLLQKAGHEVVTANSGEEALKMAGFEKPDLILMDVVMPGMNGFQATRQLTRAPDTRHIPVIIVSTKNQDTDKVWGERQGASAYITKPVVEKTLISTVDQVLSAA
jgi:twitching motility two-component system response regulator PilH